MKIQNRYRTMGLAALAISLLAIAGFPQMSSAGASANANNARAEMAAEKKAEAKGQERKAEASAASTATPTAADSPQGTTTHDGDNGPGGQVCDGDPTGHSDTGNGANAGDNYDNTCDDTDSSVAAPNGAGDGQATGKPCEGCVGAADDKNPAGQADTGPTDANNGYECDQKGRGPNEGNNGVGFGNPAHTGCTVQPTSSDCVPSAANNNCQPPCVPSAANNQCQPPCVPSAANNQCQPCPAGQTMGTNGTCGCPAGQTMGTDGTCSPPPCVPGTDAVCSQSTPSCVASSGSDRCGGVVAASVLGEQLERTEVLGVSIEAPAAAVAPATLARTGGYQLTGLVQAGLALAVLGLGLTMLGRRRQLEMIDIATRLGGFGG